MSRSVSTVAPETPCMSKGMFPQRRFSVRRRSSSAVAWPRRGPMRIQQRPSTFTGGLSEGSTWTTATSQSRRRFFATSMNGKGRIFPSVRSPPIVFSKSSMATRAPPSRAAVVPLRLVDSRCRGAGRRPVGKSQGAACLAPSASSRNPPCRGCSEPGREPPSWWRGSAWGCSRGQRSNLGGFRSARCTCRGLAPQHWCACGPRISRPRACWRS